MTPRRKSPRDPSSPTAVSSSGVVLGALAPLVPPANTLANTVAAPYVCPEDWQAPSPEDAYTRGDPVGPSADLTRILNIPRRPALTIPSPEAETLVEYVTTKYALPRDAAVESIARDTALARRFDEAAKIHLEARQLKDPSAEPCKCRALYQQGRSSVEACVTRLLPLQAWALHEMSLASGLVGALAVGAGKSFLDLLSPLAIQDCKCAVILVPSTLVEQLEDDYVLLSQHFRVPSLVVHRGKNQEPKRHLSGTDPNVVAHLIAYTRLSSTDASDLLTRIAPDTIIADECDTLADTTSVRTRRFLRVFALRPNTRFICWSGSITASKIRDYASLSALALRMTSPLPLNPETTVEWGGALDAGDMPAPPGELMKFCRPGEEVRAGYQRRLRETLGFVSSTSSEVMIEETGQRVELDVSVREAPPLPDIIKEALAKVRMFQRPDTLAPDGQSIDDEELTDVLAQAKCAAEVASGMFYRWIFPRGEPRPLIEDWFKKRKAYFREVRETLMLDIEFMDSPHLLERAAMRFHGQIPRGTLENGMPDPREPVWPSQHWMAWYEIRDRVEPQSQAVRLHDYLVQDAAQWALASPGIVWYSMNEFGIWLAQVSGLPMHGGGPDAGRKILREDGSRSIIASIRSHGRGRNGLQQRFSGQLLTQMLASSRMFQQWLGRLHRRGQKKRVVRTEVYAHTPELRKQLRQALSQSRYVHETLGERQKLLDGYKNDAEDDFDFED